METKKGKVIGCLLAQLSTAVLSSLSDSEMRQATAEHKSLIRLPSELLLVCACSMLWCCVARAVALLLHAHLVLVVPRDWLGPVPSSTQHCSTRRQRGLVTALEG